ncbi:LysM peptidoglycan-binding domain-containing protein [Fulvimarina sp. 2208YS6-2-32]|uniref:LysM peptidoglycan-binding domain-containing protein n=1 Tax=Fulvimarina uroteuthidis TaxID=3098149 RepID=A0ABU5I3H8_9HYPH|nr:LysM peptidoglycan-binding domain-containing protein [Fulvimarina sp. 2208YS6-2-32]MDY8109936.1 LysM peptidoglycan-binding domain-containing protein [Fulvimarina sp. 2208YS6-2-32]
MKTKILGIIVAFFMIIGAIVAGYWDMLGSERAGLKTIAQKALDRFSASDERTAEDPAGIAGEERPSAVAPTDVQERAGKAEPAASAGGGTLATTDAAAPAESEGDAPSKAGADGAAAPTDAVDENPAPADPPASPDTGKAPENGSDEARRTTANEPAASTPAPSPSAERTQPAEAGLAGETPSNPSSSDDRMAPTDPAAETSPAASSPPSDRSDAPPPVDALRFDVLRVEPDGSMVVAGNGPANTTIFLEDSGERIGSDTSSAAGDFVVILAEGLSVGPHAIKLVAESADGTRTVSAETAIIDVPDRGEEEQLLALVETPDRPSRLIEIPATDAGGTPSSRPGAPSDAAGSEGEVSRPSEAGSSGTATDTAGSQPSTGAPASANAESGGRPSSSEGSDTVLLPRAPSSTPAAAPAADATTLRVEAIEIEGDRIFIAGAAPAGAGIRIYLDNEPLADARADGAGRFLIEARSDIAVGEHTVRVDQLGRDGAVSSRVAVPFLRPDTGSMSAISPSLDLPEDGGETEGDETSGSVADNAGSGSQSSVADAGASASTGKIRTARPATGTETASSPAGSVRDDVSDAEGNNTGANAAGDRIADTGANDAVSAAETEPTLSGDAPAQGSLDTRSEQDPAAANGSPPRDGPAIDSAGPVESEGRTAPNEAAGSTPSSARSLAATETGAGASGTAGTTGPSSSLDDRASQIRDDGAPSASSETASADRRDASVPTRLQAPLRGREGRVLIRKGDTLWRISRETYGRGTRYTVIYLANGDQIRDPDRIYPGQIFRMPSKSRVEALESSAEEATSR